MKKVAVLGFGVIGSGVCKLLTEGPEVAELKYVCDLRDIPGLPYGEKHIKDFDIILNDPEVEAVIEVTGARRAAFELSKKALQAKKSVITSNKEVVAEFGPELLQTARENGVSYLFEAAVGGAIPLIRPLRESVASDQILGLYGIINGTTNYILTLMKENGVPYGDALRRAQELGYAEPDPSADVKGLDACRKISILSALINGGLIPPEKISTTGIDSMPDCALELAYMLGGKIKLLGIAERTRSGGGVSARVAPCFIPKGCILYGVDGVNNAILVKYRYAEDVMFYGRGAGAIPTAAAVTSDVAEALSGRKETLVWERTENGLPDEHKKSAFIITKGRPAVIDEFRLTNEAEKDGFYGFISEDASGIEKLGPDIIAVYDVLQNSI
ncbi:MAG: homoserine dehydrogenase [Clostridia bacterium]|nr:homoserine dehydrogenase [Clostridia bacterium]